ncbi:MAG: cobyrinate a,c-diamide synthase [Negativicutes bacterium]|nr:cobyrinate a,c-diamide synthase [Negativicutes bacterium]
MTMLTIPRLVIAGTSSGVGKTTIVTGLLAALKKRGYQVQSYKIGPDYIDPGFHQLASGKPAHNLDSWLMPEEALVSLFARTAAGNDIAMIEGVMGLYDGGRGGVSSTAAIAKKLSAPVILVVDAKSAGESVAATVMGFRQYDSEVNLAGVIVNRLGSASHQAIVAEALARLNIPAIGFIRRDEALTIPERHLGLTPVTETDAATVVAAMAERLSQQVNIDALLDAARSAMPLALPPGAPVPVLRDVKIGVACDEGFSFYYPESLAVLESLGAEIIPFSPLRDQVLPDVSGLIFGGGFPEMFLPELAANTAMQEAVRGAAGRGMPIYAECGGLMYLARQVTAFDGQTFAMVGVVPAVSMMQSKLQTVGYVEVTACRDNVLAQAGDKLRGHEFHFSSLEPTGDSESFPWAFDFEKMRTGAVYPGGYAADNLLASYLHMHFAGNRPAAVRFVTKCREFQAAGGRR